MFDIDHCIQITGTGSYVPDHAVTNAALEDVVRNFDPESGPFTDWVDRVTHIHERRFLHQDKSAGDMARIACERAVEDAGIDASEVELLIMATFTTKNLYPGEQTQIAHEMGMKNAATFYLTAGCAGSIYGMHVALAFLRCGIYRNALVVGTEHLTHVTSMDDPVTAILFGDAAGAAVLSRRDEPGSGGVVTNCVLGSNFVPGNIHMDNANVPALANQYVVETEDGPKPAALRHFVSMAGGPRVLRTAVNTMAEATVKSFGFTMKDLKQGNEELRALLDRAKVIPHQANGRIVDGLRDKLGVPDENMFKTVYLYGNPSCASNLLTLDYALRRGNMERVLDDEGRVLTVKEDVGETIASGDLVTIPTVGAGYLTGCFSYVVD
ncbi:MAG: ketoacyl-ACP synthase III [Planctomycetota bacterium]